MDLIQRSAELRMRSAQLLHGSSLRRLAQHVPRHVGAQLLAQHGSGADFGCQFARALLDDGAQISGDTAITAQELTDELRAPVDGVGERGAGAEQIDGALNVLVHEIGSIQHWWMSCPALREPAIDLENPALVDKIKTAERMKEALHAAFERWRARDPVNNTKAGLGRLCAAAAGRQCSPQTVSQWFKTGRMDKGWIAHVESIFGESLGFSSHAAPGIEKADLHLLLGAKFDLPEMELERLRRIGEMAQATGNDGPRIPKRRSKLGTSALGNPFPSGVVPKWKTKDAKTKARKPGKRDE